MTARSAATIASLVLFTVVSGCTNFFEVPIETPLSPKMDVTAFRRVLVAGFISGGTDDVDANLETVRLLRSQLRTKSGLRVIEADVLPLVELAADKAKATPVNGGPSAPNETSANGNLPKVASDVQTMAPPSSQAPAPTTSQNAEPGPAKIRNAKDLERYQSIFADTAFWKKIGEEYENPLIVTGTVLFTPQQTAGFVTRNVEQYDQLGRRTVRAAAPLHGAQGLRDLAEVHLHRRSNWRDAAHRVPARRNPLQLAAEHPGAVVIFRADGQGHPRVPGHAEHAENPRHPRPPALGLLVGNSLPESVDSCYPNSFAQKHKARIY